MQSGRWALGAEICITVVWVRELAGARGGLGVWCVRTKLIVRWIWQVGKSVYHNTKYKPQETVVVI